MGTCVHSHTKILLGTTVLFLILTITPFTFWSMKVGRYHTLQRNLTAQVKIDIAEAEPIVEMKCQTVADMERFDSGKECRELKKLLAHSKEEQQAEYVQSQLIREWYDVQQESNPDHAYRFAVILSGIGACLEFGALLYYWAMVDSMTLARETLPGQKKEKKT